MNAPDLEPLFRQLRQSTPEAPDTLPATVLLRLGPPALQVRRDLMTGLGSCLAAILVAALIGFSVPQKAATPTPPELTLLTRGANPLLSL